MVGYEPGNLVHPVGGLHHLLELHGAREHRVELGLVADPLGLAQVEELPVERLPVHPQVGGRERVVERHGGAVGDGFGDAVLVQIALRVVGAEDLEGALAAGEAVDGGAGETDVRGVGQGRHQVVAQVAAGGAVRLVHQHDNVGARTHVGVDAVELVNHRDDQPAVVGAQDAAQVLLALGHLHGADAVGRDVAEELRLQLVAVHQHDHRGLLLALHVAEQLGRDGNHGQGLAAALGVPDEAPALGRMPHPLDDLLDRARLVLAQDDFRQLVVFGQEDDVVVQHLEEPPAVEEGLDGFFVAPRRRCHPALTTADLESLRGAAAPSNPCAEGRRMLRGTCARRRTRSSFQLNRSLRLVLHVAA